MNLFQKILNKIKFGKYNPDKEFEQQVLGEANTNLEEIESLRTEVANAVTEYDEYFPKEDYKWNNYELYEESGKNNTATKLVEMERELQEQGKYVGMDEETRIKAVLAEQNATEDAEFLIWNAKDQSEYISSDVAEAYKISRYQKNIDGDTFDEVGFKGILDYYDETIYEDGKVDALEFLEAMNDSPACWIKAMRSLITSGKFDKELDEIQAEGYISLIMADEKSTRQTDGTYLTKTSEEWAEIDKQREQELRDMPQEELMQKGSALQKSLENRYEELIANKEQEQENETER